MSETSFTFAMGEFTAAFPTDRRYATNHMWARPRGDESWRFGLTAYAVRLLQDVYFLDWTIDEGVTLASRQTIGDIESKKAESGLYAPVGGTLTRFNEDVLDDPSLINAEPYGAGWLFEMRPSSIEELLSPTAYREHLAEAWEVAQRTIKGQATTV